MREIDLSANELICAGEDARDLWPLKEKTQLQQLEKKESFCSWFQAKNGTVEDQIPALKVGEMRAEEMKAEACSLPTCLLESSC